MVEAMSGETDQADSDADETGSELVIDETPITDEPTRKRPAAVSEEEGENSYPDWVVALKSRQTTAGLDPAGWVPAKNRQSSRKKSIFNEIFPHCKDSIILRSINKILCSDSVNHFITSSAMFPLFGVTTTWCRARLISPRSLRQRDLAL